MKDTRRNYIIIYYNNYDYKTLINENTFVDHISGLTVCIVRGTNLILIQIQNLNWLYKTRYGGDITRLSS